MNVQLNLNYNEKYIGEMGLWMKWHCAEDIFKLIFFTKNVCVLIQVYLNFIPEGTTVS